MDIPCKGSALSNQERSEQEAGLTRSSISPEQVIQPAAQTVAITVSESGSRRLLEEICRNLGLTPSVLSPEELTAERVFDFELILVDRALAQKLRPLIAARQMEREQVRPALVAVTQAAEVSTETEEVGSFDAVLAMPAQSPLLSAQLGVALYAHRAFAKRYQTALEELNLNRNIFRSVTSGISIANAQLPDMPLMYVNPAFEAMTGYTQEEVEGKNCRFLQNEDRDQPGVTLIREAIAEKRETIAVLKNYRKDGTQFWNELALSPIRNHEGELTHFVGIQMDVTERVELESALREAEKLAAVGRLASSISHEINNPLEAIMNLVYLMAQILPETPENNDVRRYLAQTDQELQRIKLITAQSLRFSKQSHNPEAVTGEELLNSVLDIYEPRFTNYSVKLETRYRSRQHIVCLVSEIRQVITNLVTNAMHAMQTNGGRLLIRTREGTEWRSGRQGIIVTVADTGKGMSRPTQDSIYKAFFTTKGAQGTGLGLWISAEIVQRHNGRMRVRSSEAPANRGTVFQLFLPYQAVSGENTA